MTWLEFPVSRRSEVGQSGAKRLDANNFRRSLRSVVETPRLLPFWRDGEPRSSYSLCLWCRGLAAVISGVGIAIERTITASLDSRCPGFGS